MQNPRWRRRQCMKVHGGFMSSNPLLTLSRDNGVSPLLLSFSRIGVGKWETCFFGGGFSTSTASSELFDGIDVEDDKIGGCQAIDIDDSILTLFRCKQNPPKMRSPAIAGVLHQANDLSSCKILFSLDPSSLRPPSKSPVSRTSGC
ncbi:hypothetical protein L6452_42753 [Arctium lappa]|uniref:Uncharacterized protein n=1 Tax=Arctium lappa TaxID=4217 RepID=A0ACB8XJ35_ARCLA|nr:hypothetical protein L6452_42753 [Arctium lappa]